MAPLTFANTHNMVAYLSKSDASARFDQIVDFLSAQVIQYALMVNPTIYVSCIKQFWATVSIKKVNDVVKLQALIDRKKVVVTNDVIRQDLRLDDADGVECLPTEEIFTKLACKGYEKPPPNSKRTAWNEFSYSMASAVICLATVVINNQVDGLSSHTTKYTSPALTQKVFTNIRRVEKGFSRVKTPLFASMLVQPQAEVEEDDVEVPIAPTSPTLTNAPSPPLQDPITKPPQSQPAPPSSPLQEQPTDASESFMTLLNNLMRHVLHCAELQGRKDDDNAATKDVSATEPTVFDDEEVTMTMAQTLIKMKAEKAILLDEHMAKRLHDEEENIDWNIIAEQIQAKRLDNIRKYQILKRKPVSIAQSRKNMIIYLKNMARYKMEHFRGMTYDKVRPIFEREYNKVQTLFKPDKDVEEPQKKKVAKKTLLYESFKKLKAVKVSGSESTHDTLINDPKEISEEDVKNILEIVPVSEFKVEALQVKHEIFMLTEKDYPLSNAVMIMMLSAKLQVEEDSDMARDLVMKIFMKANKPKSRSLDTSSK
nr:hypothetical protein [Tanacetum cinerariifolium]